MRWNVGVDVGSRLTIIGAGPSDDSERAISSFAGLSTKSSADPSMSAADPGITVVLVADAVAASNGMAGGGKAVGGAVLGGRVLISITE